MPKKSVPAVKEEKKVPAKNLGGRPSVYTLKLAEDICRVIGNLFNYPRFPFCRYSKCVEI